MNELAFAPLATFADIAMGQSPDSEFCNDDGKGLPFLQGCGEFGRQNPITTTFCSPPLRIGKATSVLISVRAPVGTMNYADQDYCIGRGLGAFKAKPGIGNTIFLKHAVEQNVGFLHRRSQGSTFAAISSSDLRSLPIPQFSLKKQERLATIFSGINTAIEKTEALIAKYQQIKAGLMHDLFTRGVLPNGQLRPPREQAPELYQETAIGWIPRQWALSCCAQMFAVDSGITLGPHRRPSKRPHSYLRVANIHRDEIRLHDVAQLEALPGEAEYSLRKYDLLVVEGHANRAEIGRCAMVFDDAEGMLFQNHLFRLRSSSLDAHYALLWMNSHHAQQYWEAACSTSSGLNTINRKMLGVMAVCVPSHSEQKQIAAAALSCRQMIASESGKLRKLQRQKLGLMQDLLTGKVQVKVHEPTPEPLHA